MKKNRKNTHPNRKSPLGSLSELMEKQVALNRLGELTTSYTKKEITLTGKA